MSGLHPASAAPDARVSFQFQDDRSFEQGQERVADRLDAWKIVRMDTDQNFSALPYACQRLAHVAYHQIAFFVDADFDNFRRDRQREVGNLLFRILTTSLAFCSNCFTAAVKTAWIRS